MAQRTGAVGLVALVVLAFVVSGCGGGSATQTSDVSRTAGTTTSSAVPTTKSPTKKTAKTEGNRGQEKPAAHRDAATHVVIPKGAPEPAPTPQQEAETPVADMAVSSPGVDASGSLSRTYTCDGKGISPPIDLQGVPSDTRELALFVMNLAPVEGQLYFDWAVAGIDPETTSLEPGQLPHGAVVGRNSEGKSAYSLCPPESGGETYILAVYALAKPADPKSGFDPAALREQAQKASGSAGLLSMSYGG